MQNLNKVLKVLLLVIFALLGSQQVTFAEQLNSVKDCLKHPEKCNQKPTTDQKTTTNQETPTTTSSSQQVGIGFGDIARMVFATIFVVALLYFILKFINKKNRVYKSSQLIENLGGTSLGANRSVQMIKVGDRLLVVGVGESIQLLKEIDDSNEYNQIIKQYNEKMEQLVQPSDLVTKLIERTKNKTKVTKSTNSPFKSILQRQLDELSKERKDLYEEIEKKGTDGQ